MNFELVKLGKGVRHYFPLLWPWFISVFTASIGILFLYHGVMSAREIRLDLSRQHVIQVRFPVGSSVSLPSFVRDSRLLPKRVWVIGMGTQKVTVVGLDFAVSSLFLPHLELNHRNGAVIGHALNERLHSKKSITLGSESLAVEAVLPPMGTYEDDLLFLPLAASNRLSKAIPFSWEWIVHTRTERQHWEAWVKSQRGTVEPMEDLIRSEILFWGFVEKFFWILNIGLLIMFSLFTYFSCLRQAEHRRSEYALFISMGLRWESIRRSIQRENVLCALFIGLVTLGAARLAWAKLVPFILIETNPWRWEASLVVLVPLLLISLLSTFSAINGFGTLVETLQGGKR